jgi:hypothetical protein
MGCGCAAAPVHHRPVLLQLLPLHLAAATPLQPRHLLHWRQPPCDQLLPVWALDLHQLLLLLPPHPPPHLLLLWLPLLLLLPWIWPRLLQRLRPVPLLLLPLPGPADAP